MSADAARIAVIRPDRQLEVLDRNHLRAWGTGAVQGVVWAGWGAESTEDQALYSWPTWDPDGRRVATFRSPSRGQGAELVVIHEGGVRTDVLLQLGDRVPIYTQWAPGGETLAVLFQEGQRLGLCTLDPATGLETPLLKGSPLFFTWVDPDHIAVFVGHSEDDARIGLLDVRSHELDLFPGQPGNFCAPVQVRGRTAYVAHRSGRVSVWLADRAAARELEPIDGLAALLAEPRGDRLARAIAPDERSPYRDLSLLDTRTGEATTIDDRPITAFFWSPTGDHLVLASTDARSGVVTFTSLAPDSGVEHHLGDIRPTRDLRFYLRFFEQFAQSHPLIDPRGKALLVPGELDRAGDLSGMWRIPLDGAPPERLGDGLLGVWGPPT